MAHSGAVTVPVLSHGGITSNVKIVVDHDGGPAWCGATSIRSDQTATITLTGKSEGYCLGHYSENKQAVLVHEFGRLLGFTSGSHEFGDLPTAGTCAHYLPPDDRSNINSTVCQHEVEFLYAAYGLRADPSEFAAFWTTPIITGFDAASPLPVPYQGSAQIAYSQYVFANQPTFASTAPMNGAAVEWQAAAPASVGPSGLVTNGAVVASSVPVTGKLLNAPPGFQLGLAATSRGTTVTAQLAGPPPPTPPGPAFRISALNAPSVPFTTSGPRAVTATIEDGGYPVGVWWWVTYSNHVLPDAFYTTSGTMLDVPVESGSYNIQITAEPVNAKAHGTGFTQNFPVCTGGGGGLDFSVAPLRDSVTTDAKAGC